MIPQQIFDEARQYRDDCLTYINDPTWMSKAATYFKDCAIRDSKLSMDEIAREKWFYLKSRANMCEIDSFGVIHYGDKQAHRKYLALMGLAQKD